MKSLLKAEMFAGFRMLIVRPKTGTGIAADDPLHSHDAQEDERRAQIDDFIEVAQRAVRQEKREGHNLGTRSILRSRDRLLYRMLVLLCRFSRSAHGRRPGAPDSPD